MRYLGLPLITGGLIKDYCSPIISKIHSRLAGWKARVPSFGRGIQLIKSILLSFDSFWCHCFPIPKGCINEIQKVIRTFLCNSWDNPHAMHAFFWDIICKPKSMGGLNIYPFGDYNTAALMKSCWKLIFGSKSIWIDWIKAKYIQDRSFWGLKPMKRSFMGMQRHP